MNSLSLTKPLLSGFAVPRLRFELSEGWKRLLVPLLGATREAFAPLFDST